MMKHVTMMTHMQIQSLAILFLGVFVSDADAERKSERRSEATHVVVGEVTSVFEKDWGEYVSRVTRIRVDVIERGDGLVAGRSFYAESFERKPHTGPGVPRPGASGHEGVPKAGERVRMFTNDRKGIYEGVYPNWYDVLPNSEQKLRQNRQTGQAAAVRESEPKESQKPATPGEPSGDEADATTSTAVDELWKDRFDEIAIEVLRSTQKKPDVPQALRDRIKNAPSISENYRSSYTFNKPSAMIEGKEFVAFLELANQEDSKRATYRFRSYSKRHKLEVSGNGEVFEQYYRITDPFSKEDDTEVIDRGSQLHINAALFKVEWSSGDHIYLGRGFKVVEAKEREYETRITELQENADQAATHPAEPHSDTEPPRPSENSAVYAKVILPVKPPENGNHPAVEPWIARKLGKRGAKELRAVTNWIRLADDAKQSTTIWNATLDGVAHGCPVEGHVSERTADGKVRVTFSGWAPFPPKITGASLPADIGSRGIAVVDTGRTDGVKSYVALVIAPSSAAIIGELHGKVTPN